MANAWVRHMVKKNYVQLVQLVQLVPWCLLQPICTTHLLLLEIVGRDFYLDTYLDTDKTDTEMPLQRSVEEAV